jgi:hypothetical protein
MITWWPLIKKIAPYLAIFGLLACVYSYGHGRGKAEWKSKAEAAESALKRTNAQLESSRRATAVCNERTLDFTAEAAARQARLKMELDKRPKVITEYVERVKTIENTIVSEDCVEAISQAAEVLNGVEAPS